MSAATYPVAPKDQYGLWRCPECHCHYYAQVQERKSNNSFGPGPLIRCVNCKSVFRLEPPAQPDATDPSLEALSRAANEAIRKCRAAANSDVLSDSIRSALVEGSNVILTLIRQVERSGTLRPSPPAHDNAGMRKLAEEAKEQFEAHLYFDQLEVPRKSDARGITLHLNGRLNWLLQNRPSPPAQGDRERIARETLERVQNQLGEALHTALRKATDCNEAAKAWRAIRSMPAEDWQSVLEFVIDGLGIRAALTPDPAAPDPMVRGRADQGAVS